MTEVRDRLPTRVRGSGVPGRRGTRARRRRLRRGGGGRVGWRGTGESRGVGGEFPRGLRHTAAGAGGRALVGIGALPVAVDRPVGVTGEMVAGRVGQYGLEICLPEVLARVATTVHHGHALVG